MKKMNRVKLEIGIKNVTAPVHLYRIPCIYVRKINKLDWKIKRDQRGQVQKLSKQHLQRVLQNYVGPYTTDSENVIESVIHWLGKQLFHAQNY